MTVDYDTRGKNDSTPELQDIEDLGELRRARYAMFDVDEEFLSYELPGAEVPDEELTVAVVPMRPDEFRCVRCFLIRHRSQRVQTGNGKPVCRDCA